MQDSLCFTPVTCFPALVTDSHVFRRFTPVTCFPALSTGYKFPALVTGYIFSRAWHRLHILPRCEPVAHLPRLAPVTCFPALCTGYMHSALIARFSFDFWLAHCILLPSRPASCFVVFSFQIAPIFCYIVFLFYILCRQAMKVMTLAKALRIRNRKSLDVQNNRKLAAVVLISRHNAGAECFLCHSRIQALFSILTTILTEPGTLNKNRQ